MKIRKYEHACFTVEIDGKILVVDPGAFSHDFIAPENVVAVVITHEHPDHFYPETLQAIFEKNPDSLLIGDKSITHKITDHKVQPVEEGTHLSVGPFELVFYGGHHAVIDPAYPIVPNLGVFINNRIYYPGDSFVVPSEKVEILALPVSAPWLKISEAINFLQQVNPQFAFPTHDAILSDIGKGLPDRLIPPLFKGEYRRIDNEDIEF